MRPFLRTTLQPSHKIFTDERTFIPLDSCRDDIVGDERGPWECNAVLACESRKRDRSGLLVARSARSMVVMVVVMNDERRSYSAVAQ